MVSLHHMILTHAYGGELSHVNTVIYIKKLPQQDRKKSIPPTDAAMFFLDFRQKDTCTLCGAYL